MIGNTGRRRVFARPDDEDEAAGAVVAPKPVAASVARRLDASFRPRHFVGASSASQRDFYGAQTVVAAVRDEPPTKVERAEGCVGQLSEEERNRLSAKILKAELAGKADVAERLRRRLAGHSADEGAAGAAGAARDEPAQVLLTRTDCRTGLSMPVQGPSAHRDGDDLEQSLQDMVRQEKLSTVTDQLLMYAKAATAVSKQKTNDDMVVDDVVLEAQQTKKQKKKRRHDADERDAANQRQQAIREHRRLEQTLDTCPRCVDSRKLQRHLVVAHGFKTYLCVPATRSLVDGHCLIVPTGHVASPLHLDEDVHEEMQLWRKGLVAMFAADDDDCVFVQTAVNLWQQPHAAVECLPVPREQGDAAAIYFKKALLECESEWAQNVKVIDLSAKGIRKSVPKELPYFAVDFGLQGGYAHIVENEKRFSTSFGQEIVAGMLDLDYNLWRRPITETFEEQMNKVAQFKERWKPFDWTERAKGAVNV